MFIMSKSLTSNTKTRVSELNKEITKHLDVIDLPQSKDPNFQPETKFDWLKEMEYEDSLLTQEQKDEAKKRYQDYKKRLIKLYPSKCKGFIS